MVFNPLTPSYQNTPLAQCYQRNELEKKRAYVRTTCERNRAWFFVTTRFRHHWRNGNCGLQTVSHNDCRKVWGPTCNESDAGWIFRCCVLPSCVFVDLDHHDTTIISTEELLTLPAQWAGSPSRTERFALFTLNHLFLSHSFHELFKLHCICTSFVYTVKKNCALLQSVHKLHTK